MSVDADQRARLLATKLAALVRGLDDTEISPSAMGSVVAALAGGTAYAVLDDPGAGGLGGAVLWASRRDATALVVFVDAESERLARMASYFDTERLSVEVRQIVGATSAPAIAGLVPTAAPDPVGADEPRAQLEAEGLEVVVEQGVMRGEVLGLEVARAVEWPADVGGDGRLHVEAGVGRFDRDAVAAVRPDEPPAEALARSADAVRQHRHQGATTHPLSLLARERWLRADLIAHPDRAGATALGAVDMTSEAAGMKDAHPAAALGVADDGAALLVVCSTGFDPALVPLGADARALHDPTARLVLAVPERDLHPATIELAGLLTDPAEVLAVPVGWV